jgi:choline dehydrogenase-like flavoprotein
MIADLLRDNAPQTLQVDILVIGAGTLGLPVATLLARRSSRTVICLESGGAQQPEDTHPLNEVVQSGTPYLGAEHGRFRCLGGTSTRWGGAMIPFQQADLVSGNWPISLDDLAPYISGVETIFGLGSGPYADLGFPISLGADFIDRMAKWPPFARRNVFNLFGKEATDSTNLSVWTNTTAVQVTIGGGGVTVTAAAPNGRRVSISAKRLIVAAGAIETTRIALLIDRQNNGIVSACTPHLGRWFADHVSVPFAEIRAPKMAALNRILGFRFDRAGGMRNIRFELAGDTAARQTLPPGFIHIGFATDQQGGFDALRQIYRFIQQRRVPSVHAMVELVRHLPWLIRAVAWRQFRKRLLFPDAARLVAHLVIEQAADSDNRITLSASRVDLHGVPLPQIHWRVGDSDIEQARHLADLFEQAWNDSGFGQLATLTRYDAAAVAANLMNSGGIYHPTGSTRMGETAAEGVVDRDLMLFGAPQVQLLSTSVLPSGGGANPTMMTLLLALRCVDQHDRAATA